MNGRNVCRATTDRRAGYCIWLKTKHKSLNNSSVLTFWRYFPANIHVLIELGFVLGAATWMTHLAIRKCLLPSVA